MGPEEVRRLAHLVAAERIEASLSQRHRGSYVIAEEDQDALEGELLAIAVRLRRDGREPH